MESIHKYITGFTLLGYFYLFLSLIVLLLALNYGRKPEEQIKQPETPVPLEPIPKVPGGYATPPFHGDDGKGNNGNLRIFVLAQEHFWECGSSSKVIGKETTAEMIEYFRSPGLAPEFAKHQEIVLIGMASEEGAVSDRARELELSKNRVRTLHEWILQVPDIKKLSGLAIGPHKPSSTETNTCEVRPSHLQRRLVVVGVTPSSPKVKTDLLLGSALRNINLPLNIDEYLDFEYWSIFNYSDR